MLVPLPAAIRFLREAFSTSGFARYLGVMERMMASICAMAFSST